VETGLLYALCFGVGIIVLAVVLTRLFHPRRPEKHSRRDINGSAADGRASATWAGIRQAERLDPHGD